MPLNPVSLLEGIRARGGAASLTHATGDNIPQAQALARAGQSERQLSRARGG